MEQAFSQVYGLPAERIDGSALDAVAIETLRQHYASWDWLYGRKLPFTFQCAGKFPWGEITIQLAAEGGIVREAAVYTDAMEVGFVPLLEAALTGCLFRGTELCQAVGSIPWDEAVRRDIQSLLMEQDV